MYSLTIVLERDNDGEGPGLLVSISSTERPGGCPFEDATGVVTAMVPRSPAGPTVAEVGLELSKRGHLCTAEAAEDVRAAIFYAARVLL